MNKKQIDVFFIQMGRIRVEVDDTPMAAQKAALIAEDIVDEQGVSALEIEGDWTVNHMEEVKDENE